jgi:hypothetical protein
MIKMSKKKGQGVIEYAGAMIVAALIVAAVLTIGTGGMSSVYNSIFNNVKTYFNTQAGNIK